MDRKRWSCAQFLLSLLLKLDVMIDVIVETDLFLKNFLIKAIFEWNVGFLNKLRCDDVWVRWGGLKSVMECYLQGE